MKTKIKYYLLTIIRNGEYENITYSSEICFNEVSFLTFEIALGHKTFILYSKEINEEEFKSLSRVINQ